MEHDPIRLSRLAAALSLAIGVATAVPAAELVVDPHGFGDHTTIQAAVQAAADGDLILVRPGNYAENVVIAGKTLWVVATTTGAADVLGRLVITGLTPTQRVTVIGLDVRPATEPVAIQPEALVISGSAGDVRLQDCSFRGAAGDTGPGHPQAPGGNAGVVRTSTRVTLSRCTFTGGIGGNASSGSFGCGGQPGGRGLGIESSIVSAHLVEIHGGDGRSCPYYGPAPNGGTGLFVVNSDLFLSGGQARGGRGGNADDFLPANAGNGGAGLQISASDVISVGHVRVGGQAGSSSAGSPGSPGPAIIGSLVERPGPPTHHVTPHFVLASSAQPITVHGAPGAPAVLYLHWGVPHHFDGRTYPIVPPGIPGVGVGGRPIATIALGVIPASGTLVTTFGMPALPLTHQTLQFAAVVATMPGPRGVRYGQPSQLVALNCPALQPDCDGNGRADLCEDLEGTLTDCDHNGVPDVCQIDCNANGVPDTCDIASGSSSDLNGDGIPDECQMTSATYYVDAAALPGGDGSAAHPFRALREGVQAAFFGGTLLVHDGVYTGADNRNLTVGVHPLHVRSLNGPAACTLDLQSLGRAFEVTQCTDFALEGLRILNGRSVPNGGGVVRASQSVVELRGCIFEGSTALDGGAVYTVGGGLTAVECEFRVNAQQAWNTRGGGALAVVDGDAVLSRCVFERNDAAFDGAAVAWSGPASCSLVVSRCRFSGNQATRDGGAIAVRPVAEHVFIDQCLFEANDAAHGAGVHVQGGGVARVTHCTFTRNVAIGTGGAALVEGGSRLVLENTILWGDSAGAAGAELAVWITGSSLELDSCTLQGGLVAIATWSGGTATGQRLLQQDPSFVAPNGLDGNPSTFADNDYRLAAGSPAVDAGHNLLVAPDRADENGNGDLVEPAPFDLAGQVRRRDDPSAPDTGVGVAPIVDHGCHER